MPATGYRRPQHSRVQSWRRRAIDDALMHSNGADVLVISSGQLWLVNPTTQQVARLAADVFGIWPLFDPPRLLFNSQNLSFFCLAPEGVA